MLNETPRPPHDSRNNPASRAAEEERVLVLRMRSDAGARSHDSRNTWLRAVGAKEAGDVCGRCGLALAAEGTVWRVRERVTRGQVVSTNVCRECAPERAREPEPFTYEGRRGVLYEPEPCEVCGRPVVWLYRPDWRLHSCCSDRCSARRYNRPRDEASAQAREKTCGVCGEAFTASRSDAKACSAKCKQKAYRQRRAAPAVVPKTETDKGEIRKKIKRLDARAARRRRWVDDVMMAAYQQGVQLTEEEWARVEEVGGQIERLEMEVEELRDAL